MMDIEEEVKQTFKQRRESLGLTAEEMARMLNVTEKTVNEWEECKKIIDLIDILNVFSAYECAPVDILKYLKFCNRFSNLGI